MKKSVLLIVTAFLSCSFLFAQEGQSRVNTEKSEKKTTHYLGFQVNQVLKEIFNFSDNQEVFTNPYFLNYQFNSNYTGFGMNFGLGYKYNETETGDALTVTTTNENVFSFRMGVEQKKHLGKKWLASVGLDALYNNSSNVTKSFSSNGFGSFFTVETDDRTESIGGGPRASIHFKISPHVLIGTEASFYFTVNKHNNKSIQTDNTGVGTITESTPTKKNLIFLGPRTILLTIAF